MRGKDFWNNLKHNVKRVTSPGEFRRCCAGDSLRGIGSDAKKHVYFAPFFFIFFYFLFFKFAY